MSENIKYPKKSEKYRGVYQRKDGTWFYRIKKVLVKGEEPFVCQESGFDTEEKAQHKRVQKLRDLDYKINDGAYYTDITFKEAFEEFISYTESETSRKKYMALYNAQLRRFDDKNVSEISDSLIDVLLLKLYLGGYSHSYISSIRKLLKLVLDMCTLFGYARNNEAWVLLSRPYKLRVLSLFSGIGAPEQAMRNLGIDYELANYCEIDKNASKAYTLLHNKYDKNSKIDESYNLWDINDIDFDCCNEKLPYFDIMFFGFPCQDISSLGKQKGLVNEDGSLTRSGLFFKALDIAMWMLPKFMIAENVSALVGKKFKKQFEAMIKELDEIAYSTYFFTLNTKDFGIPQSRKRVFMIMVRQDMKIDIKEPETIPLMVKAEDWFEENVDDEYYLTPEKLEKIMDYKGYHPNFKKDIIRCITTKWGAVSHSEQTMVKDSKGTRVLTSDELMRFQGFPEGSGKFLRENGFSKNQVGKLVGNSISVPVIQAIIKNIIDAM